MYKTRQLVFKCKTPAFHIHSELNFDLLACFSTFELCRKCKEFSSRHLFWFCLRLL